MKITLCDKCKKEIKKDVNLFDEMFSEVEFTINDKSLVNENLKRVIQLQLCDSCSSEYNKIIDGANKSIGEWLRK